MIILTHKKFDRAFKKIPVKIRVKFYQQVEVFQNNSTDKKLNNHALLGEYLGYRSIDISGDIRVIFKEVDINTVRFINIGTHSQLYG
jgi:addiction module RelE/StbE family toxin